METSSYEPASFDPTSLAPPPMVSAGSLLARTFRIFFKHAPQLLGVALVCHLPSIFVLNAEKATDPDTFIGLLTLTMLANVLLGHIASGVLAYYVFMQLSGKRIGVLPAVGVGLRRILPVVAVGLILALAVGFGYRFLLVPGIILSAMLFVSVPVVVVERTGVFRALGRSKDLTHGSKRSIVGMQLVLGLCWLAIAVFVVLGAVGVGSGWTDETAFTAILYGYWAFSVLSAATSAVASAVAYHDLRLVKEGTSIDALTSVFE
jgi:hypothetical protein